jgi:hypothetical protein
MIMLSIRLTMKFIVYHLIKSHLHLLHLHPLSSLSPNTYKDTSLKLTEIQTSETLELISEMPFMRHFDEMGVLNLLHSSDVLIDETVLQGGNF